MSLTTTTVYVVDSVGIQKINGNQKIGTNFDGVKNSLVIQGKKRRERGSSIYSKYSEYALK